MWQAAWFVDAIGAAAAASTLATFAQRRMLPMRLSAITANLFFIAYGALGSFYPVLILHLVLLPLNAGRLIEQLSRGGRVLRGQQRASLLDEWQSRLRRISF